MTPTTSTEAVAEDARTDGARTHGVLTHGALTDVGSHLRLWVPAALGLTADLWTKAWAFSALDPDRPRVVIGGFLEFRRSLNAGAVFGLGAGLVWVFVVASLAALAFVLYLFSGSTTRHRTLHVALGMILAGALGNLYDRVFSIADVVEARTRGEQPYRHIGVLLSSSTPRALRLGRWPDGSRPQVIPVNSLTATPRRQGVVRDFIKFIPILPAWVPMIGGRDAWPWIFNIADAMLVCGVAILVLNLWLSRHAVHAGSAPSDDDLCAQSPIEHASPLPSRSERTPGP